MKLLCFLPPISGEALVKRFEREEDLNIQTALVPEENRQTEMHASLINVLNSESIRHRIASDLQKKELHTWINEKPHDVGICMGFDRKIPESIYNQPEWGTINIHASLLPEYRGYDPYFHVIRNREATTGVTLHYMDEGLDTGPIIRQEEVELDPDETKLSLFIKTSKIGLDLAVEVLESGKKEAKPEAHPQPDVTNPTEAHPVQEEDLTINWKESFVEIEALLRAAHPFHEVKTTLNDRKLIVQSIRRATNEDELPTNGSPGDHVRSSDILYARCKTGWVLIEEYSSS